MEALRQIPPVNDVLRSEELSGFRDILSQPFVGTLLDKIISNTRRELAQSKSIISREALTSQIAAELACQLHSLLQFSVRRVINASGVVLHTNLGRAPIPEGAIEHIRDVCSSYSNLEFDLERGARGKRDTHIDRKLQQLLGCEAAIVVNNNAAAVLLVLNTLADGGEVVVSRGEQVEIGDSFRIPEIIGRSGARLREVGTTNRTRIKDYENGINEHTRVLLRVHPSNFRMVGFTERPSLDDFVALGKRRNIPTFEDLGSGCLIDHDSFSMQNEPLAADSLRSGIDLISFSGDKLLGGPQAGIIAGKKLYVEKVRQNPLFRALRVDKLTISALEFVMCAYLQGNPDKIPTWRMLRSSVGELKSRAQAFAERSGKVATPLQLTSVAGGGSAPETYIPSWGVALSVAGLSDRELEERLRRSDPPVIVRIEENRVILDFRTISTGEEEELLTIIRQIA